MLEISVFCVILVAAFYWATLFIMGRRDDVIHGKFVHVEDDAGVVPPAMPLAPPPFPKRQANASVSARQAAAQDADPKPVTSETLQSLLAAIQQDLKSVA
jgi:hypothetical protein